VNLTVVFERAADFTNINAIAVIGGLQIQHVDLGLTIFIDELDILPTQMNVQVFTSNATNLLKLTISYLYFQIYQSYDGNL
jgi:hypothetical protein